jgi:hypothetical protein
MALAKNAIMQKTPYYCRLTHRGLVARKIGMWNPALLAKVGSMKTRIALLSACLCCAALAQQQTVPPSEAGHIVNNVVFMSPGDEIGVNLAGAADGTALSITEDRNPKKANLVLRLKQQKGMMLFTIQNRTKYWLAYEAGIRVPTRDGLYKTSVMPVGPGLSNFESWPRSIDQLALKNFRFSEKPAGKPASR